jgi:AraC-like DNA-binding protein
MHGMQGTWKIIVLHGAQPLRRSLFRVGAAAFIPQLLEEQGISTAATFARAGLRGRPIIPLRRLGLLFKSAAAASGQTEFGLMVGLRAGPQLSEWGRIPAQNGAKVGAALIWIISKPESFPNAFLTLNVTGHISTVSCVVLPSHLIGRNQLTECAIGFIVGALRALCGPRWRARAVRFSRGPPPDPSRHVKLLQEAVSFDTKVNAVEFESAWLDQDLAISRMPLSHDVGDGKRLRQDLAAELNTVLAAWSGVGGPSVSAVASALGLKVRTLNRLMKYAGINLNQMLEEKRYETAREMLRDATVPIRSIAWSLGYTDASAFSRAFRRWSGLTPTEWRQAAAQDTPVSGQI